MTEPQKAQSQTLIDQVHYPILVVDDDHHLCQTIQWMLEEDGFEVQTARDGREAVEQALAHQPALILLDMGLPLLDGSEVATLIHHQYGTAVPIILITADGHAEEKGRRIGAVAYLHKPFDFDELIHTVRQGLKK